jgi:hypothetical protein
LEKPDVMANESNEDISYRKRFAYSEKNVLKHIQKIHQSKDDEVTKQRFLVEMKWYRQSRRRVITMSQN